MMSRKTWLSSLVALAVLLFGKDAHAVSYTFDLTSKPVADQFSFTIFDTTNTLSVLVTGFTSSGSRKIDRDWDGVGVDGGQGDDPQVDGSGPDETLRFDFGSVVVQLTQAVFTLVGRDDDFRLIVDGVTKIAAQDIPTGGVFNFVPSFTGRVFDFTVVHDNDDYKLGQLTVTAAEVPEPASMLLLGAGLLGVGRLRRARKAV